MYKFFLNQNREMCFSFRFKSDSCAVAVLQCQTFALFSNGQRCESDLFTNTTVSTEDYHRLATVTSVHVLCVCEFFYTVSENRSSHVYVFCRMEQQTRKVENWIVWNKNSDSVSFIPRASSLSQTQWHLHIVID